MTPARRRPIASLVAIFVAALALSTTATAVSASVGAAKAPVCKGKTKKKAIKAIKAAWSQVLDYEADKTLDDRFAAIENSEDPEFRATLDDIAAKNAQFLPTVTIQVNEVTCQGKKGAEVVYDLVVNDVPSPGLAGPGTAVLVGKEWKMTDNTVCDLFALADPTLVERAPCSEIVLS